MFKEPDTDFDCHRALAPDGTPVRDDPEDGPDERVGQMEQLFRAMLRARRFDERMLTLQRSGEIGTFAPIKGQEAAHIAAASCLADHDWFVPSFRETGALLLRGAPMADILLAKAGWNEGGAMNEDGRTLPDTVPVASQLPIAVGLALAGRRRGDDAIVMAGFGDGATSGGDFHEAMNFAAIYGAPVVFLCQNNGWAISTPRQAQTASATLAQKAHAYGIPAAQVDGNDALAVTEVAEAAVARARTEGTPMMIEALTYRMEVHTTADDPARYRDEEEVEKWQDRDPIDRLAAFLKDRSQLDDGMVESLETQIGEEIDAAWDDARARIDELRDGSDAVIFDHVFAAPTGPLERQRREFETLEKEGLLG